MQYRVFWEIDIEAGSPETAAKQALAIQRDPESTATVFEVKIHGQCPKCGQHKVHKKRCSIYRMSGHASVDHVYEIDVAKVKS